MCEEAQESLTQFIIVNMRLEISSIIAFFSCKQISDDAIINLGESLRCLEGLSNISLILKYLISENLLENLFFFRNSQITDHGITGFSENIKGLETLNHVILDLSQ